MSKERFEYKPDLTGDWKGEMVSDALDMLSKSGYIPEDQPKLVMELEVVGLDD